MLGIQEHHLCAAVLLASDAFVAHAQVAQMQVQMQRAGSERCGRRSCDGVPPITGVPHRRVVSAGPSTPMASPREVSEMARCASTEHESLWQQVHLQKAQQPNPEYIELLRTGPPTF